MVGRACRPGPPVFLGFKKNRFTRPHTYPPGGVSTALAFRIPCPESQGPLDRHGGVAIEDADDAADVQVHHALVVDVSAKAGGSSIPGDAAGVFDRRRAVIGDAAATVGGDVGGQGAAADRHGAVVVDAAAVIVAGVAGQGAAADRQRAGVVDAAAAVAGGVAG